MGPSLNLFVAQAATHHLRLPIAERVSSSAPNSSTLIVARKGNQELAALLGEQAVHGLRPGAFRLMVYLALGMDPPSKIGTAAAYRELRAAGFNIIQRGRRKATVCGPFSKYKTRQDRPMPQAWADRFLIFWDVFNYKDGLVGAVTAWYRIEEQNMLSPVDFDVIYEGARLAARRAAQSPGEKRKMPEGWLNDRRWTDSAYAGSYTEEETRLIDLFNNLCPNARYAHDFTPRRGEILKAALVRMSFDQWEQCFRFFNTSQGIQLIESYKGGISLVQAFSPELEARARDYLHELRPDLRAAHGPGRDS